MASPDNRQAGTADVTDIMIQRTTQKMDSRLPSPEERKISQSCTFKKEKPLVQRTRSWEYGNQSHTSSKGVKICYVLKPKSYQNIWPAIDIFLHSLMNEYQIEVVTYQSLMPDKRFPIICFGVYMSRMDSNIAEAIGDVKDAENLIVVLFDAVANIPKRVHDLLYYDRTEHKSIKCVAILYHRSLSLDIQLPENREALSRVSNGILGRPLEPLLQVKNVQQNPTPTAGPPSNTSMAQVMPPSQTTQKTVSKSKDKTKQKRLTKKNGKSASQQEEPTSEWRCITHPFTTEGETAFKGKCLQQWKETESGEHSWHLVGKGASTFVRLTPGALGVGMTNYRSDFYDFTYEQTVMHLVTPQGTASSTQPPKFIGCLFCIPAEELLTGTIDARLKKQKDDFHASGRHCLLLITNFQNVHPNLTEQPEIIYVDAKIDSFIKQTAQKVGLPRNMIFPILDGHNQTNNILMLSAWESILRITNQEDVSG